MVSFAAVSVEETGNFGSVVRFGDGEPVNGQDFGLAYAFQDRDSYFDQRRRQCLTVLWRLIGLIQWAAPPLSAFFDAVGQHRLLVPEQGIEIALRYLGPDGDLQHTNVGKAVFAEQSKGCFRARVHELIRSGAWGG